MVMITTSIIAGATMQGCSRTLYHDMHVIAACIVTRHRAGGESVQHAFAIFRAPQSHAHLGFVAGLPLLH